MAEKTATALLKEEHRSIQKVVAAMVVLADRLETGKEIKGETLREVVQFMGLVFQAHERKEEVALFPALERKGLSVHSVPVRALAAEHQKGKTLVAQLEKVTSEYEETTSAVREPLVANLRALAALYPLHIWQEDLLLFHLADNTLTMEDNADLLRRCASVDEAAGGEVRQQLQAIAEGIERAVW